MKKELTARSDRSSHNLARRSGAVQDEAATYREVRGLSRGLAVLRALNEAGGGIAHIAELAGATGLHRTTVKRLLATLKTEGLVHQKDEGSSYSLGFEVRRLSEGYIAADWIDRVAAPAMRKHLRTLSWPSDLATPDDGVMIVRESTHRASMLSQHRATIGIRIPMLVSSLGRAWLSWCSDDEREATLAILRNRTDSIGELARNTKYVRRIIQTTQKRGYALNQGEWSAESNVIAIGFPVRGHQRTIGAINLVFQANVVSDQQIAAHYAPLLHDLSEEISAGISEMELD